MLTKSKLAIMTAVFCAVLLMFSAVYAISPSAEARCDGNNLLVTGNLDFYVTGNGPGLPTNHFSSHQLIAGPGHWTDVMVDNHAGFSANLGEFTCGETNHPFEPHDNRRNVDPGAPVAIYRTGDGLDVYTVGDDSEGELSVSISNDDLAGLPEHPEHNILVATSGDGSVRVYKLTSGEFQVNAGPDSEGKEYVFIFKL